MVPAQECASHRPHPAGRERASRGGSALGSAPSRVRLRQRSHRPFHLPPRRASRTRDRHESLAYIRSAEPCRALADAARAAPATARSCRDPVRRQPVARDLEARLGGFAARQDPAGRQGRGLGLARPQTLAQGAEARRLVNRTKEPGIPPQASAHGIPARRAPCLVGIRGAGPSRPVDSCNAFHGSAGPISLGPEGP